ncbi:MAG: hypothetical protein JSS55_16965 [Proteobacteria bacterium]|nr:hypothetical protein [Pseudomonadota bacterium]
MTSDEQLPAYITDQGPILNEIGNLLVDLVGTDDGDTLLYVELQGKAVYGAIVHDRGKFVEYREFDQSLLEPVIALWRLPPKDKRWVAFKYVIGGKHFRFEAVYPEEMGPPDGVKDRVVRATTDKFGRKPVRYIEPEAPATH